MSGSLSVIPWHTANKNCLCVRHINALAMCDPIIVGVTTSHGMREVSSVVWLLWLRFFILDFSDCFVFFLFSERDTFPSNKFKEVPSRQKKEKRCAFKELHALVHILFSTQQTGFWNAMCGPIHLVHDLNVAWCRPLSWRKARQGKPLQRVALSPACPLIQFHWRQIKATYWLQGTTLLLGQQAGV